MVMLLSLSTESLCLFCTQVFTTWDGELGGQDGKDEEEGEGPPHQDNTHLGGQPWAAGVWRPQFLEHFKTAAGLAS